MSKGQSAANGDTIVGGNSNLAQCGYERSGYQGRHQEARSHGAASPPDPPRHCGYRRIQPSSNEYRCARYRPKRMGQHAARGCHRQLWPTLQCLRDAGEHAERPVQASPIQQPRDYPVAGHDPQVQTHIGVYLESLLHIRPSHRPRWSRNSRRQSERELIGSWPPWLESGASGQHPWFGAGAPPRATGSEAGVTKQHEHDLSS